MFKFSYMRRKLYEDAESQGKFSLKVMNYIFKKSASYRDNAECVYGILLDKYLELVEKGVTREWDVFKSLENVLIDHFRREKRGSQLSNKLKTYYLLSNSNLGDFYDTESQHLDPGSAYLRTKSIKSLVSELYSVLTDKEKLVLSSMERMVFDPELKNRYVKYETVYHSCLKNEFNVSEFHRVRKSIKKKAKRIRSYSNLDGWW